MTDGTMLGAYRVIDLTSGPLLLCGKVMADLGADVIKIEAPGGDATRRMGPFYHDCAAPDKSLFWFAYNTNKKSITLNIESADGREILKKLVQTADILVESFAPNYMAGLGLGYEPLSKLNPGIVMISITPFGQTGPYRDFKATDITEMAMGGFMYINGEPGRPPLRIGFPNAFFHAAVQAAVAGMGALYYRDISGEGQHIDLSVQQSVVKTTINAVPFWETGETVLKRAGHLRAGVGKGITPRQTWYCKDGMLTYTVRGGQGHVRANRALARWMEDEGMTNAFFRQIDWETLDMAKIDQSFVERLEEPVKAFFMTHTKAELYQGGLERQIDLYPISTQEELAENEQLKARDYWVELEHPELGARLTYPGAFVKASETPCQIKRRAPLAGEHNRDIYVGELGLANEQLAILKAAGAI